jgi:hypothetical protein
MAGRAFFASLVTIALVVALTLALNEQNGARAQSPDQGIVERKSHLVVTAGLLVIPWRMNYQGYLTDDAGNPVTDTLNMGFTIYTASVGGTGLWGESLGVEVENGIFNVLLGAVNPIPLDVFATGESRWFELAVESEVLSPRTEITSVAYAYRSARSDTADYALLAPSAPDNDWAISGNVMFPAGEYGLAMRSGNMLFGTQDSTHVNLGVACTTGTAGQDYGYCAVGGGAYNSAGGFRATVGGGFGNSASAWSATVSGGELNAATGSRSTVCGGAGNDAIGAYTALLGGESNTSSGSRATVGGGYANAAAGSYSVVCGGQENGASVTHATVCGGLFDSVNAYYGGVFAGFANIAGDEATDTAAVVSGGSGNSATGKYSSVSGGSNNRAGGDHAAIAGGNNNRASYTGSAVAGGYNNAAAGYVSAVGGGEGDTVSGDYSFAAGRQVRISASGDYTFAFGRDFTASTANSAVFYSSGGTFRMGVGVPNPTNALDMASGACCTFAGIWTDASSREYKKNIHPLTTEEALDAVLELEPVTYESRFDDEDTYAGFIAEDVPDLVATRGRKGLSPMDIVAVLTKVVQHQEREIEELKRELEVLKH